MLMLKAFDRVLRPEYFAIVCHHIHFDGFFFVDYSIDTSSLRTLRHPESGSWRLGNTYNMGLYAWIIAIGKVKGFGCSKIYRKWPRTLKTTHPLV